MKRSLVEHGRMSHRTRGLGTVTKEMVEMRANEIAIINGRTPANRTQADWEQARRELQGFDEFESEMESEAVIHCSNGRREPCRIVCACRLKRGIEKAGAAFFAVLDRYSLADLVQQPSKLRTVLGI